MKITDKVRRGRIRTAILLLAFFMAYMSAAGGLHEAQAASSKSGSQATAKKTKKKKKKKYTGFVKIGSRWYYYNKKHKKVYGWIRIGKKIYYARKTGSYKGSLISGWATIHGREYYFSTKNRKGSYGRAYAGAVKVVNGIACKFNSQGVYTGMKYARSKSGFIGRVGEMARDNQRKNNILATVVVAQACLETGYGKYIYAHNLFGLYGRRFSSEYQSMQAYNAYIRRYFRSLIGCRSYYTYATRIGNGGYAQASGYGSALLSIIRSKNLTRFAR